MTATHGSRSFIYLFLFLSGTHCFLESKQSNCRHRRRLTYLFILAQKLPIFQALDPGKFFQHRASGGPPSIRALLHSILIPGNLMAPHQTSTLSNNHASLQNRLTAGEVHKSVHNINSVASKTSTMASLTISSPPTSTIKVSRTVSQSKRPNRISQNFPIASRKNSADLTRLSPNQTTPTLTPSFPAEIEASPSDPSAFLVALAGQERRVLELKEELHKAEEKLNDLKKQWARYEAVKKKGEIINMEPMQQIKGLDLDISDFQALESLNRRSVEENRRKAFYETITHPKETRRKFSGAHTRTLSLLSPDRSHYNPSSPITIPTEICNSENNLRRRSTMSSKPTQHTRTVSSNRVKYSYHSNSVITSAKHLAGLAEGVTEGFKSGMWTFLEDLRQATVGEEGVNGKINPKLNPSESSTNTNKKIRQASLFENDGRASLQKVPSPRTWETLTGNPPPSIGWPEPDCRPATVTPSKSKKPKPLPLTASLIDEPDDPWLAWDESLPKSPKWTENSNVLGLITPPDSGTFDQSLKKPDQSPKIYPFSSKSDNASWPALDRFSSVNFKENLQMTMGTILKEIEKGAKLISEERNELLTRQQMKSKISHRVSDQSAEEELILMSR